MKKLLLVIPISLSIFAQETSLPEQAQNWVQQVAKTSTKKDMLALLNLIYWSYQRSAATLRAQSAFLADQHVACQAVYAITSTRLNPLRKQLYDVQPDQLHKLRHRFIDAYQEHRRIGKIYSTCLETILSNNYISPLAHDLALQLRQQARTAMAHHLYAHLIEIDKHLTSLRGHMQESYELFQKLKVTRKSTDVLFNYFWDLVPGLAVKSFAYVDKQLTDINHQLWYVLLKSEEFGNYRWQIIEEKRAEFYATYYNALYQHLQQVTVPPEAFSRLFDKPAIMLPASLPLYVQQT